MEEYLAMAMDGVNHKDAEFKEYERHHSKYMKLVKGFLSENSTCLTLSGAGYLVNVAARGGVDSTQILENTPGS